MLSTGYNSCIKLSKHQNKPERIPKIRSFIEQDDLKEIDFPSHKKLELNNKSIALNVLYVPYNAEKIRHAYKSKYNKDRENQVILLMITDGKKRQYLSGKICII